ncbi:hypothetical protein QZH41_019615 [Actinostola sp. cb2023]|nr:hypothetical protein QZH41_019615 [Actinostola sp. cb2023]
MAQQAQAYALKLAKEKQMKHDPNNANGENLAWSWSSGGKGYTCKEATESWYSEVKHYPFSYPPMNMANNFGHFTQVVWKSTKRLGVGIAKYAGNTYVVARYSPPGNVFGQYSLNVGAPKKL